MIKQFVLSVTILLYSIVSYCQHKAVYNGNFEKLEAGSVMPAGWTSGFDEGQKKSYSVKLDSAVKKSGKYALSITRILNEAQFGVATYIIPHTFKGKQIQLKGYLKTEPKFKRFYTAENRSTLNLYR